MLSTQPKVRPTIIEILNKPFVKKHVLSYIMDEIKATDLTVDNSEQKVRFLRQNYIETLKD